MHAWLLELRQALRQLRRYPGFVLNAMLTMALGIAGVSATYALVDAILLEPLPIPGPDQVVAVHRHAAGEAQLSLPDVIWLREHWRSEAISTLAPDFALDRTDGELPVRVRATLVEADYFRVVPLPPVLGRLLQPQDDAVGAPPVVVLGERYWRQQFGADPTVLGRVLQLSGVRATVVGVAAEQADVGEYDTDVWAPLPPFAPWAPGSPGSNTFSAIARLQAGQALGSARAELQTVSAELARLRDNPGKVLDATPWLAFHTEPARRGLWLLLGAAALLLVLATANVAALVLVRTVRRDSELSLRQALGATRGAILRQLLAEGLWLGAGGALIGIALAWLAFGWIGHQAALPRIAGADLDASVLAVTLLITLLSVLLFSALPAWRVRSARATTRAQGIGQGRNEGRSLRALITLEVTLASALLGSALLLAQSFLSLSGLPLGFDPGGVTTGEVVLPEARFADREAQTRAFDAMVDALGAAPGVRTAAMVVSPPLIDGQSVSHTLLIEGHELGDANAAYRPFVGDYFRAMGLALRSGRSVQPGDAGGERIAWVNEAFVRRYLDGQDPLQARVAWLPGEAGPDPQPRWMRVVGVVSDVRGSSWRADDRPSVYAPYAQREANWIGFGTLVARVEGDPDAYRETLARAVTAGDSALALGEVATMRDREDQALASDRYLLQLVGLFAALALLLGLQGVFSVVAFAAEQRRSEIGVRLALGARPAQAMQVLIRSTLPQIVAGVLLGLLLTMLAARVLGSLLYGVTPYDPRVLTLTALVLLAAAGVAAWWPARSASRLDPASTLRG